MSPTENVSFLGSAIADHFTVIAKETCRLPRQAGPFAWLSLDSEAGQLYWTCMELAGAYSAANHDCIHENVARALRLKPLAKISNHQQRVGLLRITRSRQDHVAP